MATTTIRPDGDIIADWFGPLAGSHYLVIDDAITYPSNPTGDTDRLSADGWIELDNNQYDQFSFGNTPSEVDTVTEIKIYLHGQIDNDGTTNYPEVSYDIGGGFSSDYECSSFPKNNTFATANGAWHTITISSISWTKAQIDAIQVRIRADVPDGDKETIAANIVYAVQILVTYTTAGYAAGKPLGVAPANVAKVCGVAIANIAKIKGV